MWHLSLDIYIDAETYDDAFAIAKNAADHVMETCNDEETIISIGVSPSPSEVEET